MNYGQYKSDPGLPQQRYHKQVFFPAVVTSAFTAPFTLHSLTSPSHETRLFQKKEMQELLQVILNSYMPPATN